ncbi:uncharacterized protein [Triticum aestivum]|uniref:uncharacterized protein n=1 Tax=Triticum aestivum TaxID=4565 RepID=UPI001D022960|nr:uncharacterized protein LOC123164872 [Triticum aestivum]
MATVASRLLRAARNASLASRTAAAAASRASRSARAPAAAAARAARLASASDTVALRDSCPTRGDASGTKPRGRDAPRFCLVEYLSSAEYKRLPDDVKYPTEPYGPCMSAGARLITRNATVPTWLAGSKYSDAMQRMRTTGTAIFLQTQRKRPFSFGKEKRSNYFFQKARTSRTSMSGICRRN